MKRSSDQLINYLFIMVRLTNVNLVKEPGMIAYYLHKFSNFNSKFLSYRNEKEYPYLNKYIRGVKIEFIKRSRYFDRIVRYDIPVIKYLFFNARKIDVLNLLHLVNQSALYCIIYKVLNPKGFVYLKADTEQNIVLHNKIREDNYVDYFHFKKKNIFTFLLNIIRIKVGKLFSKVFIKKLDLMSVETREIYNKIKNNPKIKNKIIYSPNGIDDLQVESLGIKRIPYDQKENIILLVGRLGTYQKGTDVFLDALSKINDLKDWKVYIIGPIAPGFKQKIKLFYKNFPNLQNKVIFTGAERDRKKLFEWYQKSKIFCLPSRHESFGIVLVEAGYFGNYLISSNLTPARDITLNGRFGKLFEIDNSNELAKDIEFAINNENLIRNNCSKIQEHIENNFLWRNIVSNLLEEMVKKTSLRASKN